MMSQLDLLQKDLNTSNPDAVGYAGKELVKLSTVLPQGLATLPLRANQDVDPANEMY